MNTDGYIIFFDESREFFSEEILRFTNEVILMRETYDHNIRPKEKSEFEKRQEWLDSLRKRHQRRSRR